MEKINNKTLTAIENILDNVSCERYATVTYLDGFIMKLKLNPPATNEIKPLPIIDVNCSKYRTQFPLIEDPEDSSESIFVNSTTENLELPLLNEMDLPAASTFLISKIVDETETPTTGPVKRVRKRKLLEDLENSYGGEDEIQIVRTATEPKHTRSAAKKLKLKLESSGSETASESPAVTLTTGVKRKRPSEPKQKSTSRSRSTSETKSLTFPTLVNKRSNPRRGKKTPEVSLPPTPELPEDPCSVFPNNIIDAQHLQMVPTLNNNTVGYSTGAVPILYPTHSQYNLPYQMTSPYFPTQFAPRYEAGFINMIYPVPIPQSLWYPPYPYYSMPMMTYHEGSYPSTPMPYQDISSSMDYQLGATALEFPTTTCQEVSVPPAIVQSLCDDPANETAQETPVISEIETIPTAENVINLDFYDPLDFEPTEDITEMDLMSIIEENMDYCAKIYNCNPISDYICKEYTDRLDTTRPHEPQDTNKEEILVPLNPVLTPEELDQLFNDQTPYPEASFIECPNCLDHLSDYTKMRSHLEVACKGRQVVIPA